LSVTDAVTEPRGSRRPLAEEDLTIVQERRRAAQDLANNKGWTDAYQDASANWPQELTPEQVRFAVYVCWRRRPKGKQPHKAEGYWQTMREKVWELLVQPERLRKGKPPRTFNSIEHLIQAAFTEGWQTWVRQEKKAGGGDLKIFTASQLVDRRTGESMDLREVAAEEPLAVDLAPDLAPWARRILNKLTVAQYRAWDWYEYGGHTDRRLSDVLGVALKQVRRLRKQAIRTLRVAYAEELERYLRRLQRPEPLGAGERLQLPQFLMGSPPDRLRYWVDLLRRGNVRMKRNTLPKLLARQEGFVRRIG
jgi:hypothetical protein